MRVRVCTQTQNRRACWCQRWVNSASVEEEHLLCFTLSPALLTAQNSQRSTVLWAQSQGRPAVGHNTHRCQRPSPCQPPRSLLSSLNCHTSRIPCPARSRTESRFLYCLSRLNKAEPLMNERPSFIVNMRWPENHYQAVARYGWKAYYWQHNERKSTGEFRF